MRIHHLQHVPFEGLGSMAAYFTMQGHECSATHLYRGTNMPPLESLDWLIVMGGPMGVHDESRYSWMTAEKSYIQKAIEAGKVVLGICLGAQMIADVLGAKVFKNPDREIGWFPVWRVQQARETLLADILPEKAEVFHWHGEAFEIPTGAKLLMSSEACANQGFVLEDRVLGFQFHMETTPDSALALVDNCADELDSSRYVQTANEILADPAKFQHINHIMAAVLDRLAARWEEHLL